MNSIPTKPITIHYIDLRREPAFEHEFTAKLVCDEHGNLHYEYKPVDFLIARDFFDLPDHAWGHA